VRIGKRGFAARIKGNLRIEFGGEAMTSYAGLEMVRRYIHGTDTYRRLMAWQGRSRMSGDLRIGALVLLLVALVLVGGRRLKHVQWLEGDPVVRRFAGLNRIPTRCCLARRLAAFRTAELSELDDLIIGAASDALAPHRLARMTLDIDGSVLTTGQQVKGARRGYNPHNRKNPSYYPITAILAQSGHVIAHRNRPGNVHDSHGSAAFVRDAIRRLRHWFEHEGVVEVRADSAFFQRDFLVSCENAQAHYAIKVPFMPYFNLRSLIKEAGPKVWKSVSRNSKVEGFWLDLPISAWGRVQRVAVFRTHRDNKPVKGQLDLFNPDDGYWEHSAVATNRDISLRALWQFMNGHGVQEKTTGELKSGLAYADIPTADMRANAAWQKLNILAHNIQTSFQIDVFPKTKPLSLKRTARFLIRSIRTLRFEWIVRAGRFVNTGGHRRLRLPNNERTEAAFRQMEDALPFAA